MRVRQESIGTIFDTVHLALTTNLLLVASCLPLVIGLVTTDVHRSWPVLAVLAPLGAPGLCAAYTVFAAYTADRCTAVVGTFLRAWRSALRPATALGAAATGGLVVLGVDARAAWAHPLGAVAIPVLASAAMLVVSTTMVSLVAIAAEPAASLRRTVRVCLYLAVRHWPLTVLSLLVLALLQTLMVNRPAVAMGLAAAPLLYVVWANSRFTLRAVLDPAATRPFTRAHHEQGDSSHDGDRRPTPA